MRYTNHSSRLPRRSTLSPDFLRRIEDCRRRTREARTHAEKMAAMSISPTVTPLP